MVAGIDPLDQLRKLAELRDAGVISEEEFAGKKRSCWKKCECRQRRAFTREEFHASLKQ